MKPHVSILMVTSIDGRLHPSRFTNSPDGTRNDWSRQYEKVHASLHSDAWLVGRVTMAEMSKAAAHPPAKPAVVRRPIHAARADATTFAVALDPSGKVHFERGDVGGDHVIVLLGEDVPDSHLAELAADGVSYIVAEQGDIELAAALDALCSRVRHQAPRRRGGSRDQWGFSQCGAGRRVACSGLCTRWRGKRSRDRRLARRIGGEGELAVQVGGRAGSWRRPAVLFGVAGGDLARTPRCLLFRQVGEAGRLQGLRQYDGRSQVVKTRATRYVRSNSVIPPGAIRKRPHVELVRPRGRCCWARWR